MSTARIGCNEFAGSHCRQSRAARLTGKQANAPPAMFVDRFPYLSARGPNMPDKTAAQLANESARSERSSWLQRAVLLVALLACMLRLAANVADPDLWGHVQFGRDALAEGLPTTTTYSYTAEGYRWINHEVLAEFVLAIGMDTLGPSGLLVCKALLGGAIVLAFFWWGRSRGYSVLVLAVSANLVAAALRAGWLLRPHLLTYVYFALLLALLEWAFAGWREGLEREPHGDEDELPAVLKRLRRLWVLPILICVWTNSHGGFVAGYCILVAYLAFRAIEAVHWRDRSAIGVVASLALVAGVSGLVTLANPYGVGLHAWMIESLGVPRPEISEWLPPDLLSPHQRAFAAMLVLTFASLLLTRRRRDLTQLAILALILWQALSHTRHIPFFMMASGLWTAGHFDSALRRCDLWGFFQWRLQRPEARRAAGVLLAGVMLMQSVNLQAAVSRLEVDCRYFPVAAMRYIVDHDLRGKMVVPYNWGQYVLAALRPTNADERETRVSVDGRFRTCYPQEVVDFNFDFEFGSYRDRYRTPGSRYDDERVLEYGSPQVVLVCRDAFHSVNVMFRNQSDWTLLFQDGTAQVWGRTAKYGDPSSPDFISAEDRVISSFGLTSAVSWPAIPSRDRKAVN